MKGEESRMIDDTFQNIPLDTPVYLISSSHRIYIGTIIKIHEIYYRGDCLKGDPDMFYREAIVDWAYLEEY